MKKVALTAALADYDHVRDLALGRVQPDGIDLTQFAGLNHVAGLAHQGMARVVMRQREHDAGLLHDLGQFLCLGQIKRHGLIAHDVKPGVQKSTGDRKVQVIGSDDADEVDPPVGRQLRLAIERDASDTIIAARRVAE